MTQLEEIILQTSPFLILSHIDFWPIKLCELVTHNGQPSVILTYTSGRFGYIGVAV